MIKTFREIKMEMENSLTDIAECVYNLPGRKYVFGEEVRYVWDVFPVDLWDHNSKTDYVAAKVRLKYVEGNQVNEAYGMWVKFDVEYKGEVVELNPIDFYQASPVIKAHVIKTLARK